MRGIYVAKRSALTRFLALTKINRRGCWRWLGHHDRDGRAEFKLDSMTKELAARFACRYVWGLTRAQEAHHLCPHIWCVNPWHLEPLARDAHHQRHGKVVVDADSV